MSTVRIYACGGTGIAISKKISNLAPVKGAAVPKIVYCDTSQSDLLTGFDKEDKFIISNVDGAGKVQKEHAIPIRNATPQLLEQYPPEALNIIIASTSGGTGSTFCVELAKQLISEGHPTIIQLVVTQEDAKAAKNSITTLKRLNLVSVKQQVPVIVDLTLQEHAADEVKSDDEISLKVATLLILASGLNVGLDTRDVSNFVYFPRVTDVAPRLLMLELYRGEPDEVMLARDDVVTMVEVIPAGEAPSNVNALYRAAGESVNTKRIIALTHAGHFMDCIQYLENQLLKLNDRLASLSSPAIDIDDMDDDEFYS